MDETDVVKATHSASKTSAAAVRRIGLILSLCRHGAGDTVQERAKGSISVSIKGAEPRICYIILGTRYIPKYEGAFC